MTCIFISLRRKIGRKFILQQTAFMIAHQLSKEKRKIIEVQISWILWKYRHKRILTMLMLWKRFSMKISKKNSNKEKNNYSSNSAKNLQKIQDKDHFHQQLNPCLKHCKRLVTNNQPKSNKNKRLYMMKQTEKSLVKNHVQEMGRQSVLRMTLCIFSVVIVTWWHSMTCIVLTLARGLRVLSFIQQSNKSNSIHLRKKRKNNKQNPSVWLNQYKKKRESNKSNNQIEQ